MSVQDLRAGISEARPAVEDAAALTDAGAELSPNLLMLGLGLKGEGFQGSGLGFRAYNAYACRVEVRFVLV